MFLCRIKACDAIDDDEPPAFSDDEEEQAYYEMLKQKNNKNCSDGKVSHKRPRQMSECSVVFKFNTSYYKLNNYCGSIFRLLQYNNGLAIESSMEQK